jgi:gluconokinase
MLWNNNSAGTFGQMLRFKPDAGKWYRRSGVPVHSMNPMVKLLWLRESAPDLLEQTSMVMGVKEYLWFTWFGQPESDRSVAGATGLMHLEKARWDPVLLKAVGITARNLPRLVWPAHQRPLPAQVAIRLGLPEGLPCVIGASDGALANYGSDATAHGQATVTIGTSAALRITTQKPVLDSAMRTFCYRFLEDRYLTGGASNNGGNAVAWLFNQLFTNFRSVEAMAQEAAKAPPGCDRLLFYPYLEGERAPLWDALATASWSGLTARHGRSHLIRAVFEGVMLNLRVIAEMLESHTSISALHAGGGFTSNAWWVQMLADVFDKPVFTSKETIDPSILGAVKLARLATGLNPLPELPVSCLAPHPETAAEYRQIFDRFKAGMR